MIKPFRHHINREGNILFEFEFIPSSNGEILDKIEKCWIVTHEFEPIERKIIKSECNCPSYNFDFENKTCKHIIESLNLLNLFINDN
jgi:hypothetical protein